MILMSLNGIKLVVTRLASPAKIGLQRLFLAGICEELKYRSPVILSRGFVHLAPDNQKHSLSITRNARRRSKFTCAEEASYHHFLRLTAFTPDVHMLSFLAQDFFRPLVHCSDGHYRHCRIRMLVQAIRYRLPASRPFGFGYLTECLVKHRLMTL